MERAHVWIQGRVQGVAFRFSTCSEARRLGLTGWVRNLPDGRVEAEFEGAQSALDAILAWCQQGPPAAYVTNVRVVRETGEPRYDHFSLHM